MTWKIHPMVLSTRAFDKSMMTYQHDNGTPLVVPIYGWYLEGSEPDAPVVVVDTGEMRPLDSEDRQQAIGGKVYGFEEALARHGLKPADVDIILHTHLHNDHCENDSLCENAVIYAHEKELESMHNPHPLDYRYLEDWMEEPEERGQVRPLTKDTEIVPGITMMHTPIHTEGGMSIVVDTEKGKAIITGFCVIEENFNPPPAIRGMEMEVIPPGTNLGPKQAYDTMLKVRDMADILLCLHEPKYASIDTIP